MSETALRVGIVGAGSVGGLGGRENSHAGGYSRCPEADLVAVADIDFQRLQQFGDEWEIPVNHRYNTAQAMYENANLDIVSVTTHNFHHHQPVIEAAEASVKIILVEKPLAVSVELGRKMVEACETRGSRLLVDHTRRFLPHYRKLKRMVNEGAVGEIKTITYSGARPLLHNGTHTVDYAFYFTDAEPQWFSGFLNQEPVSDPGGGGMVVCEDGVVVFINCIPTRRESLSDTVIAGTQGQIRFCESRGIWEYGPLADASDMYGTRYDFSPIPDMPQTFELDDYFYSATREAVDCLLEDREGVSTGRDGLKALEVIIAIHISHKTKTQVRLPLEEGLDQVFIRYENLLDHDLYLNV